MPDEPPASLPRWATLPEFETPPEGWHVRPLLKLCRLVAGQSPDSKFYNDVGDGLPFLQGAADFTDRYPIPRIWCSRPNKTTAAGSALFSVRAPVGELNRADRDYALGRGVAALESLTVDSDFLFHALHRWRRCLQRVGQGTTFDAVTARQFAQMHVAVPVAPGEQAAIARILDAADAAIACAREALAEAERLHTGIVETLLHRGIDESGGIRPDTDQTLFQSTRFGKFPFAWSIKRLSEVAFVGSGVTLGKRLDGFKTVDLPYLRVANVQDGHLNLTEIKTVRVKVDEVERYLLQSGDVLMTEGGDYDKLGRGTIWEGQIAPCLHQNHIFRVRCDRAHLDPRFLEAVIGSSYGKRYFMRIAKRTTNLASINKTQLRAFSVPVPPLTEQARIVALIAASAARVPPLERALQANESLKRGLMQDLLTGRVRAGAVGTVAMDTHTRVNGAMNGTASDRAFRAGAGVATR